MDRKRQLVMYLHGGSGNHGCEAIVNGTCRMTEGIPKPLSQTVKKKTDSIPSLLFVIFYRKIKLRNIFLPMYAIMYGGLFFMIRNLL